MRCQFEEKEYEQPLDYELGKHNVWSPGQVFENKVGFDAAIISNNPQFWKLWQTRGISLGRQGIQLNWQIWEMVEERWKSKTFPKLKFNLFVQHKVPHYIYKKHGSEYHYWNRPYFRYDLKDHQQEALDKLEKKVSSDGMVVYACPSFYKRKDLYRLMRGKLILNSNFVQPHSLKGHTRYTFIRGGKGGKACSEAEKIEGVNILDEFGRMFERFTEFENNVVFVNKLAEKVRTVIKELESADRENYFILERNIGLPEHEFGRSIMTTLIFAYFINTTWRIGYVINREPNSIYRETKNGRLEGFLKSLKE